MIKHTEFMSIYLDMLFFNQLTALSAIFQKRTRLKSILKLFLLCSFRIKKSYKKKTNFLNTNMECLKHPNMSVVKMYSSLTHGLISLPLSVFGVILNMIVISIFLQKRMRNQTNQVLIGISLFDMLMMLAYIPNSIYFYIVNDPSPLPERSEFWLYFLLIFYHFT